MVQATLAEDVAAGVAGAQRFERGFQPVGERIVRGIHAREQRIAASVRHFTGIERGAESRDPVVAVIGVPAAADIVLVVRFFAHLCDRGVARNRREEAIDVDRTETLGEGDVLLRRERLIAEEHDAILAEGVRIVPRTLSVSGSRRSTP